MEDIRTYLNMVPNELIENIDIDDLKELIKHPQKHQCMNKKAIILSRVSTGHQDIDSQTTKVKEEAIKDGYDEQDIIVIEDVESGVKLSEEERNGLNRLKQYIESDSSINCVYTYEISRISRQAEIVYSIRDFLIRHHVQLVVLNPMFRMLKDDGTLCETSNIFFGIFSAMAENEGMLRKARIKKAVEKYRAEGRHTGGNKMFGYDTDRYHNYIPHPKNAEVVRLIFDMYVNRHMSIRGIARELYDRGIRLWTCQTEKAPTSYLTMCTNVNNILHRREYVGEGRPQIISNDIFDKAQQIMQNKTICTTRTKVDALLRGMIYSEETGYLLSANAASKWYYSKRVKGPAISFACADKIVWEWIVKVYNQYTELTTDELQNRLKHDYNVIQSKLRTEEARHKSLLESMDNLEERIVFGRISKDKANELSDKISHQIDDCNEARTLLQQQELELLERIRNASKPVLDINCTTLDDKIALVNRLINRILIKRVDRTTCWLTIESKIVGIDGEKLKVDTYHKKLIEE